MLSFYMGDLIPGNKQFLIDNVSFKACASTTPVNSCRASTWATLSSITASPAGFKRWVMTDGTPPLTTYNTGLHNQGDFFYDASDWTVRGLFIEQPCDALLRHRSGTGIPNRFDGPTRSYITCQNLDL